MKQSSWNVYSVITETATEAYKMLVPAPDKKTAIDYVEGNGEVVSCKVTDWDIDVEFLAETLARTGWGQSEIDIITRTLYISGLDRVKIDLSK